jgi:hypothetical protein
MFGRLVLAALFLPLLLVAACSHAPEAPPVADTFDISVLRQALDSSGLPVTSSESTAQGAFGRAAQYQPLEVVGRPLHVYWFPSPSDALSAASIVRSDGRIGSAEGASGHVAWNGYPHFFRRGSLLAVYVSKSETLTSQDTRVLRVLARQMGPTLVGPKEDRPLALLGAASATDARWLSGTWVLIALAVACSLVLATLVVVVVVVWVRIRRWYVTLREAGLRYRVSPQDAWSPETIEAVFVAYNPARVRSDARDERPYDVAARAIFGVLPQGEPGQRERFDELFDQSWSMVPRDKAARPRTLRRVADRLWEMHTAAFRRWESDE